MNHNRFFARFKFRADPKTNGTIIEKTTGREMALNEQNLSDLAKGRNLVDLNKKFDSYHEERDEFAE